MGIGVENLHVYIGARLLLGLKSYRPYSQGLSSSKPVERELIKEIIKRSCPRLQTAGK